ncbi:glycerol-3-phosphate dehydrogenase/oxidase [Labedaea rhizosphaerae]|uniref:glycerol-3-phosphate dehydrogenase/oxidase n=1 Tax=Labedaea rhizosphaerae TaxID=598644 RepID=UPI00105F71B9|nr:glycerol-3-phosphate dehydrogenase/oxidase [Labedaea rhizosphaerae]
MSGTSLNAARRRDDLAALAREPVDLLIVGGGVTGAGVALDAASRGLSVALVEAHDLAFGTSRWSSKLVHGGLRYLARGDVGLARESAIERDVVMRVIAPHLTRSLPQLIALRPDLSPRLAALTFAGLGAGDVLRRAAGTPGSVLPRPRRVSAQEALALVPGLNPDGLRGGLLSFDGQLIDDARLVVALARTAAGFGAKILTRVRMTSLGSPLLARDELTGTEFAIDARAVVNAAGVWADQLVDSVQLRPSRGSHLVLDGAGLGVTGTALTVPIPGHFGRYLLVLPQQDGRVYLGLTDEPVDGPVPDVPAVPQSDVDFLLGTAATVLRKPLRESDVLGAFAGLRPLVAGSSERSADLSRHHAVLPGPDRVVTVVGGKLTTYRKMAEDAVDAVVRLAGLAAGPCRTRRLPLVGAGPRDRLAAVEAPARLVARYGVEAPRVAAAGEVDPDLARPLAPGIEVTEAEVLWAVRHEGALDADDVLDRRTRIGLVAADANLVRDRVTGVIRAAMDS